MHDAPPFSEISKTWAGCPLRSFDLVQQYINETKTETGLIVQAYLVTKVYQTGIKVSPSEMQRLNLKAHAPHPEWNYTISSRR